MPDMEMLRRKLQMEKALKRLIRETYEAACMECGYEEGLEEVGYEEEALEEYLAEAKKSMHFGGGGRFSELQEFGEQ